MKPLLLSLLLLNLGASLMAQEKLVPSGKGASPVSPSHALTGSPSVTRAVVVGISDYQDPAIPDLKYADRDAEAFANFLHSPAGGSLTNDQIILLTNEQATASKFTAAIDWLIEQTKEGDRAVIYFSGHGDMEAKILNQLGFLLLWDSPAHAYIAGALPVDILKNIVTTLSVEKKAKVLVVADACRAGKLAGNNVTGTQLTNASLARQFANEQKILSCQADEYSIEGEQWGGGRGAFSWHLVNGLYGLADLDGDGNISLLEIERYLQDRVSPEVAPLSQIPFIAGNKMETIGKVNAAILARLKKDEAVQLAGFSDITQRGLVQESLAKADTAVARLYLAFQAALQAKRFFEPAGNCAEDFYQRLQQQASARPLFNYIRRNYAAALQDDAQQVLNLWLKTDLNEIFQSKFSITKKYRDYPRQLDRAAGLLGESHYMYDVLQARKLYFEGCLLALNNQNPDIITGEKALAKFREALRLQPGLPHAWLQMGGVFGNNLQQPDSMKYCALQAAMLAPAWVIPHLSLASFAQKMKQWDRAREYLEQASLIDSNAVMVLNAWGSWYNAQKQYERAEPFFKKAFQMDSSYAQPYFNLGTLYFYLKHYTKAKQYLEKAIQLDSTDYYSLNLGILYYNEGQFDEAEQLFKKAIQSDSMYADFYYDLGNVYYSTGRYAEAEQQYRKVIQLDSTLAYAYMNLGGIFAVTDRPEEAEQQYKKAIRLDSASANYYDALGYFYLNARRFALAEEQFKKSVQTDPTWSSAWYNLACLQSLQQRAGEGFDYLENALKTGYDNFNWLQQDSDLALLRERTEQWKALMKKYFPEQFKN